MPYKKSQSLKDFESQIASLRAAAIRADRDLTVVATELRDMVFQCAIFQTSAAMESYLRLIVEVWIFELKLVMPSANIPLSFKARLIDARLRQKFASLVVTGDETQFLPITTDETELWRFLHDDIFPSYFTGSYIHEKTAYPSWKNLIRLLRRVGVSDPKASINSLLEADGEVFIEAFQSIRTALAHTSPPQIQLLDLRLRLDEMTKFIRVVDRIMYRHIMSHGGASCWR